ncbi:MAG: hypothetical protein ACLFQM_02195 [Fidelibacterota bacterium]
MEKAGYVLLGIIAVMWFVAIFTGLIVAMPYGLIGLIIIVGFGLLFIKVLKERLESKEDDYYSKNVDK